MKCTQECRKDLYLYVRDHLCYRIERPIGCVVNENKQNNNPVQAGIPNQNQVEVLELVYRLFFGANLPKIREHVKLKQDTWIRHLKTTIIDEEEHHNIFVSQSYNLEDAVVNYLIKKNEIKKYKTFIAIWKYHDPPIAQQFEYQLKVKIKDKVIITNK